MTRARSTTPTKAGAALAALLPVLAILATAAAPASAGTVFTIKGHGFGHGVGMSQYGAYGYAKHGVGYKKIVGHYYKRTKLERVDGKRIDVLLDLRQDSVSFKGARRSCGTKLNPGKKYRAKLVHRRIRLTKASGKRIAGCGKRLAAKGRRSIKIGGEGRYRGKLLVKPGGEGLYVINSVDLDSYVKGVIPNEVPSSWPADALRAQAVAARSYALGTDAGGNDFDQFDDTRSQVYGGVASETSATNKAAKKTGGRVLTYHGKPIPAFFFSTSGGRTENVEYGFPGAEPQPYLKSVKDPYDDASPYHSWRMRKSRSEMESALSGLVDGKLRDIEVTKRGESPRIVKAKIVGSRGRTKVSGTELRDRLGLYSTWAKFRKRRGRGRSATASAVPEGLDGNAVVGLAHPELEGGGPLDGEVGVSGSRPLYP